LSGFGGKQAGALARTPLPSDHCGHRDADSAPCSSRALTNS